MLKFNDTDYELLSSYLDDALTPTEKAALETRLQADSDLLNELEALRVVQQAVQSLPILKAPRNFQLTAPMIGQAAPARKIVALPPRQNSWWVSAAAALVVAVVGIGLFVANNQNTPTNNQGAQVAAAPSATMNTSTQTAAATDDGDVARQATNETATFSPDNVIEDMVAIGTQTNMMVSPGVEPSFPMQPVDGGVATTPASQSETEITLFNTEPITVTNSPESVMGGAALSTGTSEERFGTDDAANSGAADLAIQQQAAPTTMQPASTQMALSTLLPAPTMNANTASMVAPVVTPTIDIAGAAMAAPAPTIGEVAAPSEQSDSIMSEATVSQKGILPFWWSPVGTIVTILQTVYLLLTR